MIVTLELAPGAILAEQVLSAELGIGRTPVREALQRLALEGLVLVLPRKAIIVTETDPRRQLLVLEVRRELERLLARASAERATEAERWRFRAIADGMEAAARTSDDIAFMRLDRELNALLAEAAHNEVCLSLHALPQWSFTPVLVPALQAGCRPAQMRAPACRRGTRRR